MPDQPTEPAPGVEQIYLLLTEALDLLDASNVSKHASAHVAMALEELRRMADKDT
jgi:hypothetical protein